MSLVSASFVFWFCRGPVYWPLGLRRRIRLNSLVWVIRPAHKQGLISFDAPSPLTLARWEGPPFLSIIHENYSHCCFFSNYISLR
jgi:hypothetical protein